MGWWRIRDVESGGIDWDHKCPTNSQLANAIPGEEDEDALYNGDQSADLMDSVLDEINEEYKKAWGRTVKQEEVTAVFNFCRSGKFDGTGTYIGETQIEEEKMSGNGREPKGRENKELTPVEQMQILSEHGNAVFKIFETLMYDDRIDDGDVRWRLDSVTGVLAMLSIEIDNQLYIMKNQAEDKEV